MTQFTADFSKRIGIIKALHGVNNAPYSSIGGGKQPAIQKMFSEAHIPYCRLHDTNGSYGGTYFVDVPNIFRNFDADENDPASYDFYYTDEYIAAIQKTAARPTTVLVFPSNGVAGKSHLYHRRILESGPVYASILCAITMKAGRTVFTII